MPLGPRYKSLIESIVLLGSAIVLVVVISISFVTFLGNSTMPNVAVSTGSMLPIYNGFQNTENSDLYPFRGDILLVKKVPVSSLNIGDVIVFDTTSIQDPVVHRIIAKWVNNSILYFKTNGDNNLQPDGWTVEGKDVIGLVVIRIPHIGWFLLVIQTDLGKVLVILAAFLVLFGEDILPILGISEKKDLKQSENNKEGSEAGSSNPKISKNSRIAKLKKREFFYTGIAISILFIFLMSNVISSMTLNPSLNCYQITDSAHSQSLLDSSPNSMITLSDYFNWLENSQQVYFFPILIEITSGGIFNNIDRFQIKVNKSEGTYGWNIVYNFGGVRYIEGGIISHILGNVEITIDLYSRGVFADSLQTYSFFLILES
ncbi:MAG: signal peptidase I [Candidatus Hodarchaeales archaeon]